MNNLLRRSWFRTVLVLGVLAWTIGALSVASANTKDDASATLTGTTWSGTDSDGDHYVFTFEDGGTLAYTSPNGSYRNGTWNQFKGSVYFEMNNHTSEYLGSVVGPNMEGKAWNRQQGSKWTWKVSKQTKEIKNGE